MTYDSNMINYKNMAIPAVNWMPFKKYLFAATPPETIKTFRFKFDIASNFFDMKSSVKSNRLHKCDISMN